MGVLSNQELKRRVLMGELLILKRGSRTKKLDKSIVKRLEEGIDAILLAMSSGANDKPAWRAYTELLLSKSVREPEILNKRRQIIEECIKGVFLNTEIAEIGKRIASELNEGKYEQLKANETGAYPFPIFVDDLDCDCFREADLDLRLGRDTYVTSEKTPKKLDARGADGVLAIEPGEFGILLAHEFIFIPPDLIGFISIRFTFKQKGLVNISGFHADPGFYGRLVFSVFNAGPNDVPMRCKERVFMIMFNQLTKPYPEIAETRWQGMRDIPVDTIFGLRGTSVSVRNLDERIKKLETFFPLVVAGVVGTAFAVIAWVINNWKR